MEKPKVGGKTRKGAYKRALQAKSISESWGEEQRKAFLTLKIAMISAPVLKTPQYDGRIFRVVMDGSKKGFRGVLSQEFETDDLTAKQKKTLAPNCVLLQADVAKRREIRTLPPRICSTEICSR